MAKSAKKNQRMKQPQKMKVERYVLSKAYRQVAWQLNKAYDEVRNAGFYSNNTKLFEQTLEGFYKKWGKKVSNLHHISMQAQMPKEAIEELADITIRFADIAVEDRNFYIDDLTKGMSPEDRRAIEQKQQEAIVNGDEEMDFDGIKMPWDKFDVDKYNQIQDLYGIKTVQEFINWTDEMERFRSSAFLQSVLNSDQIADIFAYSYDAQQKNPRANLDFDSISKMVYREYMKDGFVGDALRGAIYARIAKTYKGEKKSGNIPTLSRFPR